MGQLGGCSGGARRGGIGKELTLKAEEYRERKLELAGWPVNISSYRLGAEWRAKADNVSPGAGLCRTSGATREEAEEKALKRAEELLSRTRRNAV